jgi:aminomethyltransferase
MCRHDGGIIDDLTVYRLPGRYMLVVNAANRERDLAWLREHLEGDATVEDATDRFALIAIQGPASQSVLSRAVAGDLDALRYYFAAYFDVAGTRALVSRTGYTGEDGFEIYCDPDAATGIWRALAKAGSDVGIEPIGLGARDTLRLEMGYALYGNEMDESRTPVEAGLMWVTKLGKGDFIGRDAIAKRRDEGARLRLIGFELEGRGVPRTGQLIRSGGREVGVVTSGTFSPSLEVSLGMGYVSADVDGAIEVEVRGRRVPAELVSPPFYRHGSVRRKKSAA